MYDLHRFYTWFPVDLSMYYNVVFRYRYKILFFSCLQRGVLVLVTNTIWHGKIGARGGAYNVVCACNEWAFTENMLCTQAEKLLRFKSNEFEWPLST